jgi:hypothetical protein
MNQTFNEHWDGGQAIAPQSVNAGATLNGTRIVAPHKVGEQLVFILNVPALTGVTAFT